MNNHISRRTFIAGNAIGLVGASIATFGTVVDWRSSVTQQVQELATRKGLNIDAVKFAETWRGGYQPAMNRVRTGELPWTKLDDLHRLILNKLLVDFGIAGRLSESEIDGL